MDRIAQAGSVFGPIGPAVTRHDARAVAACPLRYVVDREASGQCSHLVRSSPELLATQDDLLRLPARSFWLEWLAEEAEGGGGAAHKIGALVQAEEDGRSGSITPYWAKVDGPVLRLPGAVVFDLDRPFTAPHPKNCLSMRHRDLAHIDAMLSHTLLQLNDVWATRTRAGTEAAYGAAVQREAEGSWFVLPFVLAFSALLNSDHLVDQRRSQLRELNATRQRRERRPLLDHIEVSLRLGERRHAGDAGAFALAGSARATPRLHFVRGHTVARGGKTFWRTAHLRGDADAPICSKTVTVLAGGAGRRLQRSA